MCGIVGYLGEQEAQPMLMDGLSRLAYRGYDSAGIAAIGDGEIRLRKARGKLDNLKSLLETNPVCGSIGIGHTRWATHGEPSDLNAHPHTDSKGGIAVVHNGIIENHEKLRAMLIEKGCTFVSETDTEVIAHLLHLLDNGDMADTLRRATAILTGSYALCVLSIREPDKLFCTRKDSPLILGLGEGEQFAASDIPAIIGHTATVQLLEDREIAVLSREVVTIFDALGRERVLTPTHVDWDVSAAEKSGFPHFMLKEIHEEPDALRRTFSAHVDAETMTLREALFPLTRERAREIDRMTITACGTAMHAGLIGKKFIEHLAHIPVEVEVASELRYREPLLGKGDLLLAISQSGETADTLAAMKEATRLGAEVMALTNVLGSSITRAAQGHVLYTYAGPEIAVASTKAFITQVEMMLLFAIDLALKKGVMTQVFAGALLRQLDALPSLAAKTLELSPMIQRFSSRYFDRQHIFYIGRGVDHALAMEASLKLKEVSYIFSEAYAAGELKHGTIALVEQGTLVCAIMTQPALAGKLLSNIREVKSRGAQVLLICPESLREEVDSVADTLWVIPDTDSLLSPLLAVIPVQLLAYAMALSRGCDVDMPRNLAKSVTVE